MLYVDEQLPADIGERVSLRTAACAGQDVLVVAWRVVPPRFLLGGSLDGVLQVSLQVVTAQGDDMWVDVADVTGRGAPVVVSLVLPFTAGDAVLVAPTWVPGEVRSWAVTGRRLETVVRYHVHLDGTPTGHEMEVNAHDLEPQWWTPGTAAW